VRAILIYGGNSLITKNIIHLFYKEYEKFYIFTRNIKKTKKILKGSICYNKIILIKNNLLDLNKTLNNMKKIKRLEGVIWIAGYIGNPSDKFHDFKLHQKKLKINFLNIVFTINYLLNKILHKKNNFICVVTSAAGVRGKSKNLFYSLSKGAMINYLSGLRQKLHDKIKVITVIPGYIKNKKSTNRLNMLSVTPEKLSKIIYDGIKNNDDIVYTGIIWRIILFLIKITPESLYKRINI
jgi:decaprenylphospho-beta-D-erythro-pentofuranosid-2-ulose 2-reductase